MNRCKDCKHMRAELVHPSPFLLGLDAMYPWHKLSCHRNAPGFFGWPTVTQNDSCSEFAPSSEPTTTKERSE